MRSPFTGKGSRLNQEIYLILRLENKPLTPYDTWKLIVPSYKNRRKRPPAPNVVWRRMKALAKGDFLEVTKTEKMPSGQVKKYYSLTKKFHLARRLRDSGRRQELVDLLTETIMFDEEVRNEAERLLQKLRTQATPEL